MCCIWKGKAATVARPRCFCGDEGRREHGEVGGECGDGVECGDGDVGGECGDDKGGMHGVELAEVGGGKDGGLEGGVAVTASEGLGDLGL
ncbi:hypothetical protein PIB30_081826 [Stylosanthes scabra]|uniref:Uncharacterized protein n=1 Tax=Stylosanthes scabra TaxID=79078 RepID=A0ABU6YR03_9FABA|nr:hypothetical protein [Stylosanthes scabra]